jgi:hypothetical protein
MIAEQAVLDERVRIAREVHDVVAHHVSVMGVQAGAGRRVMDRSPQQAAQVLKGIGESSRLAVAELPAVGVFALRNRRQHGGNGPPAWPGPPGSVGGAGQRGRVAGQRHHRGDTPAPARQRGCFRLPGGARGADQRPQTRWDGHLVTLTVRYGEDQLELSVVDDGRGRSNGRTDRPPRPNRAGGGPGWWAGASGWRHMAGPSRPASGAATVSRCTPREWPDPAGRLKRRPPRTNQQPSSRRATQPSRIRTFLPRARTQREEEPNDPGRRLIPWPSLYC